jgi:glycosyltransferase involved in cell wall biosynthesis
MRILHVVPTYLPATRYGGPIYSVHGLARAQVRCGEEVHVYTTNIDGLGDSSVPLGEPVELDGVSVWYFPCGAGRRLCRSPLMGRSLRGHVSDFDVLHLHSAFLWPTLAAARAARKARIPYVLAPRGMLVADLIRRKSQLVKSAWVLLFERANIEHASAVHVTSEMEATELARLGLSSRRIAIVPNGIDLPNITDAAPDAHRPLVLSLGRINWKKGLDRLICAMTHLPHASLVIAGNDEEGLRPRLEEIARAAGVAERVQFIGPVCGDAKWALMRKAHIFALPSYSENFGNAVLEAMACAIPVVVTPEVGLATTVVKAGAGLVVAGAPDTFGPALAELIGDVERRAAMGAAGRAAAERFSWDAIAEQMKAIYYQAA